MTTIAFLGLGAMGSRMTQCLLKAGHNVAVYNRTPERARALEKDGARFAASPREAAEGAELVFSMVTDDEASRDLWCEKETGALQGIRPGAIAIESSSVTIDWVRELAGAVQQREALFLDAPVVGSRPQADAAQLIVLAGGETEILERAKPALQSFSTAIHHVGPTGHGIALKLAVNALFAVQVTAIAELLGVMLRLGVGERQISNALSTLPVMSPAGLGALRMMEARNFAPLFPVDLAAKDVRYWTQTAQQEATSTPLARAASEVLTEASQRGWGGEHLAAVVKLFVPSNGG